MARVLDKNGVAQAAPHYDGWKSISRFVQLRSGDSVFAPFLGSPDDTPLNGTLVLLGGWAGKQCDKVAGSKFCAYRPIDPELKKKIEKLTRQGVGLLQNQNYDEDEDREVAPKAKQWYIIDDPEAVLKKGDLWLSPLICVHPRYYRNGMGMEVLALAGSKLGGIQNKAEPNHILWRAGKPPKGYKETPFQLPGNKAYAEPLPLP